MYARSTAVLIAAAGLVLGVSACTADSATTAAPTSTSTSAATATAAPTSTATAAPTSTSTAAPTATAPPATAPPTKRPSKRVDVPARTACPATESDLQDGVPGTLDNGVSPKSRFGKIECYRNYAVATIPESADSDEQYVVFRHTARSWSLISSGSAEICEDVPADVVKRFRKAHYGACR